MTPTTIEALQESVTRLRVEAERAADESHWPGAGLAPEDFTNPIRRARFKATKLAARTLALLGRQEEALEKALYGADPGPEFTDDELAAEVARFEAEAAKRIAELGLNGGASGGTTRLPNAKPRVVIPSGGVPLRPTT